MQSNQEKLLKLKAEYEKRIEGTSKHIHGKEEPVSADFAEQVVELENEDVIVQLDEEAKQELALVNRALRKIEDGSYGVCETCANDISEPRLEALPQATMCIKCAE